MKASLLLLFALFLPLDAKPPAAWDTVQQRLAAK